VLIMSGIFHRAELLPFRQTGVTIIDSTLIVTPHHFARPRDRQHPAQQAPSRQKRIAEIGPDVCYTNAK
jgi:hypothetical protein